MSTDIKSMELPRLAAFMEERGEPSFRARQLYDWMHKKMVSDFSDMTNIPNSCKEKLKDCTPFFTVRLLEERISKNDGTRKYLFSLSDDNIIESVLMRYKHGLTACISSQVGCRMGCRFCASTLDGLVRNLTPAEMLDQVYVMQKNAGEERISNIVIMGAGEPLDNYDSLVSFIRIISGEEGRNISQRNITVSTCGIVPAIRALAQEGLSVTLALSLHAPNDEIRKSLMPIANKYSLQEVLGACRYYFEKTGRRVSYEYSLVAGVNDNLSEAARLYERLRGMGGHINLIPVNPIKERDYKESTPRAVLSFKNFLEKKGMNVTVRREMGRDIEGACGQLRRHYLKQKG